MSYIRKRPQESHYVRIPNILARNKELSFRARGLICHLLSLPDNSIIHKTELYKESTEGRDAVIVAFNELVKAGYITVEKVIEKDKPPRFDYVVDSVQSLPITDFQERVIRNGKSVTDNQEPIIEDKKKVGTSSKKKKKEIKESDFVPPSFEDFWPAYNKKGNRLKGVEMWDKLSPQQKKDAMDSIPFYFNENPNPKYRLDAQGFLNQKTFISVLERERDKQLGQQEPASNAPRVKLKLFHPLRYEEQQSRWAQDLLDKLYKAAQSQVPANKPKKELIPAWEQFVAQKFAEEYQLPINIVQTALFDPHSLAPERWID